MACIPVCPEGAIHADADANVLTDFDKCTHCFKCVEECYFNARNPSGKLYTVSTLFKEVMKDEVVFRTSGGGVTLSGGEPTQHKEFCVELLKRLRHERIHTAVETCGYAKWENLKEIAAYTDLFLYDIKAVDAKLHMKWTGVDNSLILENAQKLAGMGAKMIIRVPLITDVNDDENEFGKIARFAAGLDGVSEMHILPFHQIGSSKYEMTGSMYEMHDWPEQSTEKAQQCKKLAENAGLRVSIGGSGFVQD